MGVLDLLLSVELAVGKVDPIVPLDPPATLQYSLVVRLQL